MKKLKTVVCFAAAALVLMLGVAADGAQAAIGSNQYETLKEALDAAQYGDTLRLLSDCELDEVYELNDRMISVNRSKFSFDADFNISGDGVLVVYGDGISIGDFNCAYEYTVEGGYEYMLGTVPDYGHPQPQSYELGGVDYEQRCCAVNTRGFRDAQSAFDNTSDGDTVTLLEDVELTETVNLTNKLIYVDCGEHSFRGDFSVSANGILVISGENAQPNISCDFSYDDGEKKYYFGTDPWIAIRAANAKAVASVDGTEYKQIGDALLAAKENSVVTILQPRQFLSTAVVTQRFVYVDSDGHNWGGPIRVDDGAILALKDYDPDGAVGYAPNSYGGIKYELSYTEGEWTYFYGGIDELSLEAAEFTYDGQPHNTNAAKVIACGEDISAKVEVVYSYYSDARCTVSVQAPTEIGTYYAVASVGRTQSVPATVTINPPAEEEEQDGSTLTGLLIIVALALLIGVPAGLIMQKKRRK